MTSRPRLTLPIPLALGVSSRLSQRIGASPIVVRVAFLVLTLAAGAGVVAYLVLAALMHDREEPEPKPVLLRHNVAVVMATAAGVLMVGSFVPTVPMLFIWPVGLVVFAAAFAEPTADPEAAEWRTEAGRVLAGVILMIAGLLAAISLTPNFTSIWMVAAVSLVLIGGVALLVAPFFQRMVDSAAHDRRERIRAEERTDLAAHLHDSVLQTLTLIQNRASDPQITAALAHRQERELRRWLYAEVDEAETASTFRSALEAAAEEVEDQYLKIVECIVIGDTALTPPLIAAVGAAREAMVNAGKFAEIPVLSVYAEVTEENVLIFVRDRGVGFDLADVPGDRHGLTDSIEGRVKRVGGTSNVRSSVGWGTEVRIEMPVQ